MVTGTGRVATQKIHRFMDISWNVKNCSKFRQGNWEKELDATHVPKYTIWGFPKMVGFPNKPMGFPAKNDHFGVWNGGTTIWGNTHLPTFDCFEGGECIENIYLYGLAPKRFQSLKFVEKCVASAIGSKLEQKHLTNMQNTHHSEFEWEHFCFALFGA